MPIIVPMKYRRTVVLTHGVDFQCQPHGMVQQLRNKAATRGYQVAISSSQTLDSRAKLTVTITPIRRKKACR